MSVQNLRNKFNQPTEGAMLSSPGTSFGTVTNKFNKNCLKPTNGAISTVKAVSVVPNNHVINLPKPSSFLSSNFAPATLHKPKVVITQNVSTNGTSKPSFLYNGAHASESTRSESPRSVDSDSSNKSYVHNKANKWGTVTVKKAPEQSREDIIRNRWNKSVDDNRNGIVKEQSVQKYAANDANNNCFTNNSSSMYNNNSLTNNISLPDNINSLTNNCNNSNNHSTNNNYNCSAKNNKTLSRYTIQLANDCNKNDTSHSDNVTGVIAPAIDNGDNWRSKYEESEAKNKETSARYDKLSKEYNELASKYTYQCRQQNELKELLYEKSEQLTQLRTLSEAMCKEYDQLKTQYDLESTTMQKAMERATQWYKQNRELKRRSSALMQHVMSVVPDKIPEMMIDETDSSDQDGELEELRNTIKDLTRELSKYKAEVKCTNSYESDRTKETEELNIALKEERNVRSKLECQYKDLEMKYNQLITCSDSHSLSSDFENSSSGSYQINSQENNSMGLEAKLKLTESELNLALQRAKHAEDRMEELLKEVTDLESQLNSKLLAPPPPPPMPSLIPPPPPPPPMPQLTSPNNSLNRCKLLSKSSDEDFSATDEMAHLLGIPRKAGVPQTEGDAAIDKIINELKGGRFTLKATEKQNSIKKEEPPVVHEMRNILGTLRKQPARRESFKRSANNSA